MPEPELLYESTGLRVQRNATNQFVIIRLHYTADPAKRSDAWRQEAASGMLPAKWEQEYEISYEAGGGTKVFPEIVDNAHSIILHPPFPDVPLGQQCWGGFDFGQRNPSAFIVFTIDRNDIMYAIWEVYEPCRNTGDLVEKIKLCPYWDRLSYISADPSIFNNDQFNKFGNTCSTADLLYESGLTKLMRGNKDEGAWLTQMRKHWASTNEPTFRIFDNCEHFIHELEDATFMETSDKMLLTANHKEAISNHNNHALDACKYFMNSRPRRRDTGWSIPPMYKRYVVKY